MNAPTRIATPARPTILPSVPQLVPLRRLIRAEENVRHIRIDEDVEGLAADIRTHGLLTSLIGYLGRGKQPKVHIVGGGRRLQALDSLMMDNAITGDFEVPVLIREPEQALELSLAENLQQRTMSPVDEFHAFKALIDTGRHTAVELAKRFGFSERVVKQRLRLAALAPDVLDALAERAITIDAAMAYARTQDRTLQAQVFAAEKKRTWDAHSVRNIKQAIASAGMKTSDQVYRFVGAKEYERAGGGYEDDLFHEDAVASGHRVLAHPILLQEVATSLIEFQMLRRLREFQDRKDLSPTIDGYVVVPGLKLASWGYSGAITPPPGYATVDSSTPNAMWRAIREQEITARVLVGINDKGELILCSRTAFVPPASKQAVEPAQTPYLPSPLNPVQQAEAARVRGTLRWSRRLAVHALGGSPLFAGSPLEGRAWWADHDQQTGIEIDGVAGMFVRLNIFVTDAEIDAQRAAAEKRYAQELADEAARDAAEREAMSAADRRFVELSMMNPPAIVVIDGAAWERDERGAYTSTADDADVLPDWDHLLDVVDIKDIGATFATRDEWQAALAEAEA